MTRPDPDTPPPDGESPPPLYLATLGELVLVAVLLAILAAALLQTLSKRARPPEVTDAAVSWPAGRVAVATAQGAYDLSLDGRSTRRLVPGEFTHVALSPAGDLVALAQPSGALAFVDAASGELVWFVDEAPGRFDAIAFSPEGGRLAVAGPGGAARVIDIEAREWTHDIAPGIRSVSSVAFLDGDRLVLAGSLAKRAHAILIVHLETGAVERRMEGPEFCFVQDLAISPDRRTLAAALSIQTVRLWNLETGTEIGVLPVGAREACFSPDGERLALAHWESATIWSVGERTRERKVPAGRRDTEALAFRPGDGSLVTVDSNSVIRAWHPRLASGDEELGRLFPAFSPVPWPSVIAYIVWMAVWIRVNRPRPAPRGRPRDPASLWLAAVGGLAILTVAVLGYFASPEHSGGDPLRDLPLLTLGWLGVSGVSLVWLVAGIRRRRGRLIFTLPALLISTAGFLFFGFVFVEVLKSV